MNPDQLASSIEAIIKEYCPTSQVAVVSSRDVINPLPPGYYLGVSSDSTSATNLIQTIMSTVDVTFVKQITDETGELLVYFIPPKQGVSE